MIAEVERVPIGYVVAGNAFAAKEDVLILQCAIEISFFHHLAARPVPIQCVVASRFLHSPPFGIVVIRSSDTSDGSLGQPVFPIVDVGEGIIGIAGTELGGNNISGSVIAPVGSLVFAVHIHAQGCIAANGGFSQQISPVIVAVGLIPAPGSGGKQAVQTVILEAL